MIHDKSLAPPLVIVLVALLILAATAACAAPTPVTAFVTATPTNTLVPTNTPAPTATPTPTLTPTPTPLPSSALLEPTNYQPQTYNNCGPCSIAILLGYYGPWITQHEVNDIVPPGPSVCASADYMPHHQLEGRAYQVPSLRDPIRLLLANGIPVIASQRLELESDIGHYRVIKGYDDAAGEFISDDPLQSKGPDYHIDYETFARLARRGAFVAVYPPEMDAQVQSLMRSQRGVHEVHYCPP